MYHVQTLPNNVTNLAHNVTGALSEFHVHLINYNELDRVHSHPSIWLAKFHSVHAKH